MLELEDGACDPRSMSALKESPRETVSVAVIIPYFQREPGILARALRSVVDQRLAANVAVRVIIIDDASPSAPELDCSASGSNGGLSAEIIRRPNGGPGAARNTGLDFLGGSVDFVAFLDSDDCWKPEHLQTAIDSLGGDCDLYFCDHQPSQDAPSYFAMLTALRKLQPSEYGIPAPFLQVDDKLALDHHRLADCFIYKPGTATESLAKQYVAHTSTIVFRCAAAPEIRFEAGLRSAGEDYLFVLNLAHRARRVCYSKQAFVIRGLGVGVYMSVVSWNHPENLKIDFDNLQCFLYAQRDFRADPDLKKVIKARIGHYRMAFLYKWFRRCVVLRKPDFGILMAVIKSDAGIYTTLPRVAFALAFRRMGGNLVLD